MMQDIVKQSLTKAIAYSDYRDLSANLVAEKKTSGPVPNDENLAKYTAMNEQRSKRLDKTIKISQEKAQFFQTFDKKITFLAITEFWCGDAAQSLPVVNKIAELNEKFTFKLVFRDENEPLMNLFLTNGGKAIPIVVFLDEAGNVLAHWGSRPSTATQMVEDFKAKHGSLTVEFKEDLQKWYNQDKGNTLVDDFVRILKEI
ncbi:thioredoxin family protein [Capnocytophaga canimorsus]|uniref:thioredoxin family protein n=1 Tax=Capnocytophaga canimorsus TaxID=28188 RepID=UPI00385E1FA1